MVQYTFAHEQRGVRTLTVLHACPAANPYVSGAAGLTDKYRTVLLLITTTKAHTCCHADWGEAINLALAINVRCVSAMQFLSTC
jgi:hypothetical protein